MNFMKRIYFVLLTVAPYLVVLTVGILFENSYNITERFFNDNFYNLAIPVALVIILTLCLTFVYVYKCHKNKWEAYSLAKTMMIIKIIHIPAYIAIFVLGAICALTVFSLAFTYLFIIFDYLLLVMSGLMTSSAVLRAMDENPKAFKKYFWLIPVQFVFCVDVFATVLLYKKLKTEKQMSLTNPE